MADSRPRLSRRQWILRIGGFLTVLAAGAIIAGVLVSKEQKDKRPAGVAARPDTVVQSVSGGPSPVAASSKPLVDADYPYQFDGKATDPAKASPGAAASSALAAAVGSAALDEAGDKAAAAAPFPPANSSFWGALTARGWQAVGGGSPTICYPKDGVELVDMTLASSPCVVIVLTRSNDNPYNIRKTMNITSDKVIVGNPVNSPLLQPKGIERHFNIYDGGSLDLRSIVIYRGSGRKIPTFPSSTSGGGGGGSGGGGRKAQAFNPANILETRLLVGGTALIYPGGNLHAVGVTFTQPAQTLNSTINDIQAGARGQQSRTFGGVIAAAGGNVRLDGCFFLTAQPYGNYVGNTVNLGREVLVLAGQVTLNGVFVVNVGGFSNVVSVGNAIAVLGGLVLWSGGGITGVTGVQAQWGIGTQIFVGTGALIDAGMGFMSVNGCLVRAAFAQFTVGGGVHVRVGFQQTRVWGTGFIAGYGQTFGVGGGIQHVIGAAVGSVAHTQFFAGSGGTAAVGAGDMMWVGVAQARAAVNQAQYGLGLVFSLGSGQIRLIESPEATTQVARIQVTLGTVTYVGDGLTTWINITRFTAQLATAFYGLGNQVYVGAGGIISTISKTFTLRVYEDRSTGTSIKNGAQIATTYTVGGRGASGGDVFGGNQQNTIFMTNRKFFCIAGSCRRRVLQADNTTVIVENKAPARLNFAAVVGDEFREYNITSIKPPSSNEPVRASTAFNGLGDQWEKLGFKFQSWDDVAKAYHTALTANPGLSISKVDPEITQAYNKIKVLGSNKKNCLIANVKPSAALGSQGFLDTASKEDCVAVDYAEETSNPYEAYSDAISHVEGFEDHAPLLSAATASGSGNRPNSRMLHARLTVNCVYADASKVSTGITSGCVDSDLLKYLILDELDLPSTTPLTVAAHSLPISVAERFLSVTGFDPRDNHAPTDYDNACSGYTTFELYSLTQDVELGKKIKAGFEQYEVDPGLLTQGIQDYTDGVSDKRVCGASLKIAGDLLAPGANLPAFRPSSTSSLAPSVSIGDGVSVSPPTKLTVGDQHSIFVSNFPDKSDIVVKLIQGTATTGPIVANIANFRDNGGFAEVAWLLDDKAVGKYKSTDRFYLYAFSKQLPALFSTSPVFTIRTIEEQRRRR